MYLSVELFDLIQLVFIFYCWDFDVCFCITGEFLAVILSNNFSAPFFLPMQLKMQILVYMYKFIKLFYLHLFIFHFASLIG